MRIDVSAKGADQLKRRVILTPTSVKQWCCTMNKIMCSWLAIQRSRGSISTGTVGTFSGARGVLDYTLNRGPCIHVEEPDGSKTVTHLLEPHVVYFMSRLLLYACSHIRNITKDNKYLTIMNRCLFHISALFRYPHFWTRTSVTFSPVLYIHQQVAHSGYPGGYFFSVVGRERFSDGLPFLTSVSRIIHLRYTPFLMEPMWCYSAREEKRIQEVYG